MMTLMMKTPKPISQLVMMDHSLLPRVKPMVVVVVVATVPTGFTSRAVVAFTLMMATVAE